MPKAKQQAADTDTAVADEYVAAEMISEPDQPIVLTPTETALATLNQFDVKVMEARKLKELSIAGITDKVGYKKVEEARLKVKRDKVLVKNTLKTIVEPVNRFLRQVHAKANEYTTELKEIEDELDSKSTAHENEVAAEKERIAQEAEAKYLNRLNQVQTIGAAFNGHSSWKIGEISLTAAEMRSLSDERFIEVTHLMDEAAVAIREEQRIEEERVAAEKAEQERIAAELKAQAEKQEAERLAFEVEKRAFAAEQLAIQEKSASEERERLAKIAKEEKELKDAQLKLRETRRRTQLEKMSTGFEEDTDNRVLAYKGHLLMNTDDLRDFDDNKWDSFIEHLPEALAATDLEIAAAEEVAERTRLAEIKAAETAALKAQKEKEAADKKERERQDALRPDKEKLESLIEKLAQVTDGIELSTKESKTILLGVEDRLSEISSYLTSQLSKL